MTGKMGAVGVKRGLHVGVAKQRKRGSQATREMWVVVQRQKSVSRQEWGGGDKMRSESLQTNRIQGGGGSGWLTRAIAPHRFHMMRRGRNEDCPKIPRFRTPRRTRQTTRTSRIHTIRFAYVCCD